MSHFPSANMPLLFHTRFYLISDSVEHASVHVLTINLPLKLVM